MVVPMHGPVQRRRAVRLRCVGIGAFFQQRSHRVEIPPFGGIRDELTRLRLGIPRAERAGRGL